MCDVPIEVAYDPTKALNQTKCWLNEVVNGQEPDWMGYQEFACLHGRADDTYLAQYQTKLGPDVGFCGQDKQGIEQPCSQSTPWLRDPAADKCSKHFQLEEVMGLNLKKMAADKRSFAWTMAEHSQPLNAAQARALFETPCECQPPLRQCASAGGTISMVLVLILVIALMLGAGYFFYRGKIDDSSAL